MSRKRDSAEFGPVPAHKWFRGLLPTTVIVLAVVMFTQSPAFGCTIDDVRYSKIGASTFITAQTAAPSGTVFAEVLADGTSLGESVVGSTGKISVSIGSAKLTKGMKITIRTKTLLGTVLCTKTFILKETIASASFTTPFPITIPSTHTFDVSSPIVITGIGLSPITLPLAGSLTAEFASGGDPEMALVTVQDISLTVPAIDPGNGVVTGPSAVTLSQPSQLTMNLTTGATDGKIVVAAVNDSGTFTFDGVLGGTLNLDEGVWDMTSSGDVLVLTRPIIPTLSEWGLIILTLLVVSAMIWFVVRRRRMVTV